MEEFLQSLLQFQHFRQFLNSRIDAITKCNQKEKDVFDCELLAYEEGLSTFVVTFIFLAQPSIFFLHSILKKANFHLNS